MSLLGNIAQAFIGGRTADKAAGKQMDAEREALALQREMYETQRADFAPYMQAGVGALGGLQALTSPDGRAQALNDYYASDEFSTMQGMANTNAARNAAVTGGLRSGSNYLALEGIAPQLGQSYLTNMYNQQTGLANLGMGATSQGAQSAYNFGNQGAMANRNMGMIGAQNAMAQGQMYGNILGSINDVGMQAARMYMGGGI
tara:strand:+ start:90 stop:695 length:606 start_codon:yes stop_codon:yes gene_type:complete